MTIIRDLRTLTAIATRYNLTFDYKHKYITNETDITYFDYKHQLYKLTYLDGCFYPFITKAKEQVKPLYIALDNGTLCSNIRYKALKQAYNILKK